MRKIAPCVFLVWACSLGAQTVSERDKTLSYGDIADGNLTAAISFLQLKYPNVLISKQEPYIPNPAPRILFKGNRLTFDWTPGQHARYLMEEIRQGVHAVRGYPSPELGGLIGLTEAQEVWPELRDIDCKDAPETDYYDLEGIKRSCPK